MDYSNSNKKYDVFCIDEGKRCLSTRTLVILIIRCFLKHRVTTTIHAITQIVGEGLYRDCSFLDHLKNLPSTADE